MSAEDEYEKIIAYLEEAYDGESGQMFGKKCVKVHKKAAVAFFQECLVFKLPKGVHAEAISLEGSILWDPSGKNRPMKEWVQVTMAHQEKFEEFAKAAAEYVG